MAFEVIWIGHCMPYIRFFLAHAQTYCISIPMKVEQIDYILILFRIYPNALCLVFHCQL